MKLFLKGTKCFSDKCPIESRNYPPGQHGISKRSRISDYAIQLREKQKVRKTYGVLESQFRKYFSEASRKTGITGDNLVKLLERRFDNTVYRLGLAPSRKSGRQLILHKHFLVNGKSVNIPSYLLKPGDSITVRDKSKKLEMIHDSMKRIKDNMMMPWLSLDKANMKGVFMKEPDRAEVPFNANEQLIVELYSK